MAITNRFISLLPGDVRIGKVVEGSATSAGAYVELRMQTQNSTNGTNITAMHIEKCLEVFKMYLRRGGVNAFPNTGTKALPDPSGPPGLV